MMTWIQAALFPGLAAAFCVAAAQAQIVRPPAPSVPASATACASMPAGQATALQLSAKITDAQIAYLHARSREDSVGALSRQCEAVVLDTFKRLARLKTPEAAAQIGALAGNPALRWDFADRDRILTIIAADMGAMVLPYLRPHSEHSLLALEGVACIGQGHDNCM